MKNHKANGGIPPPDIVNGVRISARNGAATLLPNREDVLEEIAAKTVTIYITEFHRDPEGIRIPRAWAFRVGRNLAQARIDEEERIVSLDAVVSNHDDSSFNQELFLVSEKCFFQDREEVFQALPELFEWFQARVIDRLDSEDHFFYERYYLDNWSEEQIADALKISPKAVAQRWRRLLVRMRQRLVRELPNWEHGNELFAEPFKDPKSLLGLLCLIRLFIEEGMDAIRGIVDSFTQK